MPKQKLNKISEVLNQKIVSNAIIERYGSQKACATALGISEQNLSHKIKRLSNKFIHQLLKLGVVLPLPAMKLEVKEPYSTYGDLKTELEEIKKQYNNLQQLLDLSLRRIKELEGENAKLSTEIAALLEADKRRGSGKINNI